MHPFYQKIGFDISVKSKKNIINLLFAELPWEW